MGLSVLAVEAGFEKSLNNVVVSVEQKEAI